MEGLVSRGIKESSLFRARRRSKQTQSSGYGAGTAVGAIAGGLLGSQIGKGNGRVAGAAVGAATGAMSGHYLENRNDGAPEQRCYQTSDGYSNQSQRSVSGYVVTCQSPHPKVWGLELKGSEPG